MQEYRLFFNKHLAQILILSFHVMIHTDRARVTAHRSRRGILVCCLRERLTARRCTARCRTAWGLSLASRSPVYWPAYSRACWCTNCWATKRRKCTGSSWSWDADRCTARAAPWDRRPGPADAATIAGVRIRGGPRHPEIYIHRILIWRHPGKIIILFRR